MYQILTNNVEVCIPSLSSILLAVLTVRSTLYVGCTSTTMTHILVVK